MSAPETCDVLVIGGGPAGLRAAELTSAAGFRTILADRMRSLGRKFLVAGRGGLNLTHAEPLATFVTRYGLPEERWRDLLTSFSPAHLRAWAAGLGVETFVGTSQRVFPLEKHAAPLLRRWIERLRGQGVSSRLRHRLIHFRPAENGPWVIELEQPEGRVVVQARALVLALGGASWPQTGCDGSWVPIFTEAGIPVAPLAPANSGYEIAWSPEFLAQAEGKPLKNIVVSAGGEKVAGELLITRYGLEGGALYQLSAILRHLDPLQIFLDLKPTFTPDQLIAKLQHLNEFSPRDLAQAWRLGTAAENLLAREAPFSSKQAAAAAAKALPLHLRGPRPIEEAISSAGGVKWESLDSQLMLKTHRGIFCAGEMIDWEAPTGGYLLQGCFATGTRAAQGVVRYLTSSSQTPHTV